MGRVSKLLCLTALGGATLLAGSTAHAGQSVERPWHERGSGTIDLATGEETFTSRVAHLGLVSDDGDTLVAANGDELYFVATEGPPTDPACSQNLVRRAERLGAVEYAAFDQYYDFTGGTGRFEGASGSTHTVVCYMVFLDAGVVEFYIESKGSITY